MFETMTTTEATAWMNATSSNGALYKAFVQGASKHWSTSLTELLVGNTCEEQETGRWNLAIGIMDDGFEGWGDRWGSMLIDFLRDLRDEHWNNTDFIYPPDAEDDSEFLRLLDGGFSAVEGGYTKWAESMANLTLKLGRTRQWTWGEGNSEGNVDWLDWVTAKYTGAMPDLLEEVQADIWEWVEEMLKGATRDTWSARDDVVAELLTQGLDYVEEGYTGDDDFRQALGDALDSIKVHRREDEEVHAVFLRRRDLAVDEGEGLAELGKLTVLAFYLGWDESDIANRYEVDISNF